MQKPETQGNQPPLGSSTHSTTLTNMHKHNLLNLKILHNSLSFSYDSGYPTENPPARRKLFSASKKKGNRGFIEGW